MRLAVLVCVAVILAALLWFAFLPHPGSPPPAPEPVGEPTTEPAEPPPDEPPHVVLPEVPTGPGVIRGTVRRGGEPVAARIEVRRLGLDEETRLEADAPRLLRTGRSDADGNFEIRGLPTGRCEVTAVAADGARGSVAPQLAAAPPPAVVHIVIAGEGLTFSGRAVWSDGRAFSGEIGLVGYHETVLEYEPSREAFRRSFRSAGADGGFRFGGLPPGIVRPVARRAGRLHVIGPRVRLPRAVQFRFVVDAGLRPLPGRVVDAEGGVAIAGAEIEVEGLRDAGFRPSRVLVRTRADRAGCFEILVPPDAYIVFAQAEGFELGREEIEEDTEEVILRLAPEPPPPGLRTIRGTVVTSEDGRPVAAAVVQLLAAPGGRARAESVETDAEGRYEIQSEMHGSVLLYVHGGGWVSTLLARRGKLPLEPLVIELPDAGVVERDLTATPAAVAKVTVLGPDGLPAENVEVRYVWSGWANRSRELWRAIYVQEQGESRTTDGRGECVFEDLYPEADATFRADSDRTLSILENVQIPTGGETVEVILRIPAGAIRRVRVVFAGTGEPVVGAELRISGVGRTPLYGFWMTDASGCAELGPMPSGEAELYLTHPEVAFSREAIPVPDGPGPHVIELTRGMKFGGTVTWPDGSPASGAIASVWGDWQGFEQLPTVTDVDGKFLLRRIPPGEIYRLEAAARRGNRWHRASVRNPTPGRRDYHLCLEEESLPESSKSEPDLEIRVRGPDGGSISGGRVSFYGGTGNRWVLCGRRGTADVVRFHYEQKGLTAWSVEVVGARVGKRLLAPNLVELSSPTGEVEIRLEAAREITGRVVDEDGKAVLGVSFTAFPADPRRLLPQEAPHGEGGSGEKGEFVIRGLGDGPYVLWVTAPEGYAIADPVAAVGGARNVVITLRREADVVVTLLDWKSEPVPKQSILVRTPGGGSLVLNAFRCTTDEEGRVRLRGLDRAKRYQLQIWVGGLRIDLMHRTIDPWIPADTVIRLERAYLLAGTVTDGAGAPTRAQVWWRKEGEEKWRWEWTREGKFRLEGLPFGEYELKAVAPRAEFDDPGFPVLRVTAGQEAIVLRLP